MIGGPSVYSGAAVCHLCRSRLVVSQPAVGNLVLHEAVSVVLCLFLHRFDMLLHLLLLLLLLLLGIHEAGLLLLDDLVHEHGLVHALCRVEARRALPIPLDFVLIAHWDRTDDRRQKKC